MQREIASKSTPRHNQLLTAMDLEKDKMRISLQHQSMQVLFTGP